VTKLYVNGEITCFDGNGLVLEILASSEEKSRIIIDKLQQQKKCLSAGEMVPLFSNLFLRFTSIYIGQSPIAIHGLVR
jgi:hypothetical protein